MNNTETFPIVYFQLKKLKKIWEKYGGDDKTEVIAMFDEKIKEIEEQVKYDV